MEILSRAEKIMKTLGEDPEAFDNRAIIETVQDCFAVIRIERTIASLSNAAGFNEGPRNEMHRQYDLLDVILVKYGLPKSEDDEN
jgi:hypothetical protein